LILKNYGEIKMKTPLKQSLHILISILFLSFSMSVLAVDKWAGTTSGGKVVNEYGECYQTIGGSQKACSNDTDGDGVPDDMDKCPDTPKGVKVDADGCPLDTDGDGVPDYMDKCPQTPTGATVDEVGCMKQLILNNIEFVVDSSELTMDAKASLDQVADAIRVRPDIKSMSVIGHTDNTGSDGYNQKLSEKRARAVADYLRGTGVSSRFVASGSGEKQPIADNATEEGRARNRRVELNVMN
jgi:OOP family OmpA-OmpF porin